MQVTRRFWTSVGVGSVLLVLGALTMRPVLLVGAAVLGAWLVARQIAFVRAVQTTATTLEITQRIEGTPLVAGQEAIVTIRAERQESTALTVTVTPTPPVSAQESDLESFSLAPTDRYRETVASTRWPVAGSFAFQPPLITLTDAAGLFRTTLTVGEPKPVQVEPRIPRNIHVGAGGQTIGAAYGDHPSDASGPGFDPAELREYSPGDPAQQIDWKTTARLGEPYVREHNTETDRRTVLVVDSRREMAQGPAGETKLDYMREIALAFVERSRESEDPTGFVSVGPDGILDQHSADATSSHYARLRSDLQGLTSVQETLTSDAESVDRAFARRAAATLGRDVSSFGRVLAPYFSNAQQYQRRIEDEPLFAAVRTASQRARGSMWVAIFTDDSNRAELRETVELARRGDTGVFVFMTPTALFEQGGLADLDTAYNQYREFEEFRQELDSMPRVFAFEVGPSDRLDAILERRRNRREVL